MNPKCDENGEKMFAKGLIPGRTIKAAIYFGKEFAYTIGTDRGFYTRKYNMTQNILSAFKNNYNGESIVNKLCQKEFLRTAVFQSSVHGIEWEIVDDKLNLFVYLKYCDVMTQLSSNVMQYAVLLKMMAQVSNLAVGNISYLIEEPYIYKEQVSEIKQLCSRWELYKELQKWTEPELLGRYDYINYLTSNVSPYKNSRKYIEELLTEQAMIDMILYPKIPELWLNPNINDFFKFDNSSNSNDIKIRKYAPLSNNISKNDEEIQ